MSKKEPKRLKNQDYYDLSRRITEARNYTFEKFKFLDEATANRLDKLEKAIKYVAECFYVKRTGFIMEGLNKILEGGG